MWDNTPIDLFFAHDVFHDAAAAARVVPFADHEIPILSVEHLVVQSRVRPPEGLGRHRRHRCRGHPVDVAEVLRWVGRITGDEDRVQPCRRRSRKR